MSGLTHAFYGMDDEDHRVRRVIMVGAVPEGGDALSANDRSLLRDAVSTLKHFRIPLSDDLSRADRLDHDCGPESVRVINIQPQHGGEDFLLNRERGDVVILCNIRKDVEPVFKLDPKTYDHAQPPSLTAAFMSSAQHDDHARWTSRLLDTGAKFTFVYGADNFELDDLNQGQFVSVGTPRSLKGFLINRNYFEHAEAYLSEKAGPLCALIGPADDPRKSFFYDTFGPDPASHRIRPALPC